MTPRPQWSFVVPVHDEIAVLPDTWAALCRAADALGEPWECVAVDDGSTDGSAAWLAGTAVRDPRLVYAANAPKRGKGHALRSGVAAASGSWIVTLDADLATDLEALPRTRDRLAAGARLVYGDRRHPDSRLVVRQPRVREFLGRGFAALSRALVAPGVRDLTCGWKAYTRDTANALFSRTRCDGWAHDAELLAWAARLGIAAEPIAVRWSHGADSKVRLPGAAVEAGLALLAIRRRVRGA